MKSNLKQEIMRTIISILVIFVFSAFNMAPEQTGTVSGIVSDENGNAFGGHLAKGTIVFASEFLIQSFEGAEFIREFDEKTNLRLWK